MSSQQRSLPDPRPDEYRILHEADLRDYLAGLPAVAARLGGDPASWTCVVLMLLTLSAPGALAGSSEAPKRLCSPALGWCMPPQDGGCEHPKVIFEGSHPRYDGNPFSRGYEKPCILRAKSFAERRGGELQLTFGNGTTRAYKDNRNSKVCGAQGGYEDCKRYMLYDFFPEHGLFLINVGYSESQEWRLVRQRNGKEEAIVAPPRCSPNKKWLAAVNWTDGPDDGNNGIDIVSATHDAADRSFHYRPKEYELWEFVGWDGDERLSLSVTWRVGDKPDLVTWPAEVVRANGEWQLNRRAPD
jgi:hypothetical protein